MPRIITLVLGLLRAIGHPRDFGPRRNDRLSKLETIDLGADQGTDGSLVAIVERMPQRSRAVFLMSHVDGLSYAEIARELRISRRAVTRAMVVAIAAIDRAHRHNLQ